MSEKLKIIITAVDQASSVLSRFGAGLAKWGIAAGATAFTGLSAAVGVAIKEASAAQDVLAGLDAVLKSTSGVAGITADMAAKLAASLQATTKFSDEAVLGAENLLLTFTNIGKDVFPEATKIVLDMSQALGQDLKSSAIQLGKALQDPEKGITALKRVGVNFNEESKAMIESLVESGKVMEAQKFILKELQTEFGGAAQAAGKTASGQFEIFKNKLSDVAESAGNQLLPVLTNLLETLGPQLIGVFETMSPIVSQFFQGLAPLIPPLVTVAAKLFKLLADGLVALMPAIQEILPGLLGLLSNLIDIVVSLSPLWKALGYVVLATIRSFAGALEFYSGFIADLVGLTRKFYDGFVSIVKSLIEWFITKISDFTKIGGQIVEGITAGVKAAAVGLWNAVKETVLGALQTAKNVLGISSPSKVFADEVGHNIMAGVAMGIKNFGALPDLPQLTLGGTGLQPAYAGGYSGGANSSQVNSNSRTSNITNNFNISGRSGVEQEHNLLSAARRVNNLGLTY